MQRVEVIEDTPLTHSWEQSWETVTIVIPAANKKDTIIKMTPETIDITVKTAQLTGKLLHKIYPAESTWYFNGGTMYVELAKADQHTWWSGVIDGIPEKEIAMTNRKKHEYPEHVQAMLDQQGEQMRMAQERPDLVRRN